VACKRCGQETLLAHDSAWPAARRWMQNLQSKNAN
jgi:hypothetical protein